MLGIMWARSGFRMILHRDNWQGLVAHAFDALVVEINVGYFNIRREAVGLHRKTVIV